MSYWQITEVVNNNLTHHIVWSKREIQICLDTCILPKLKEYHVEAALRVNPGDRKGKEIQHLKGWERVGWNFHETRDGSTLKFKINFFKG